MVSKLTGNTMWESSRMMLPEHVEALNEHNRLLNVKEKPLLDVDAIEDIERAIAESLSERKLITLYMYDKYEDLRVTGVVERVDTQECRVRVDGEWFKLADIIGAGDP